MVTGQVLLSGRLLYREAVTTKVQQLDGGTYSAAARKTVEHTLLYQRYDSILRPHARRSIDAARKTVEHTLLYSRHPFD
jgi:hypothetical protein